MIVKISYKNIKVYLLEDAHGDIIEFNRKRRIDISTPRLSSILNLIKCKKSYIESNSSLETKRKHKRDIEIIENSEIYKNELQ